MASLRRVVSSMVLSVCMGMALPHHTDLYAEAKKAGPEQLGAGPLQFADLPVPRKMRIDRENSYSFYRRDVYRIAKIAYQGKTSLSALTDFYVKRMKLYGWKLEKQEPSPFRMLLVFRKQDEVCEVSAFRQKGETDLQVKFSPR